MLKMLTFLLSLTVGMCFAQQNNAAVFVVGKVLNGEDSVLIREKFFSGLRSKAINRLGESELYFKEVIQLDPANHAALYELANIYHAQDEEKSAEKFAREAVTVNSTNKWYWLLLADIYKKTKNYEQLTLVFSDLIHLDPSNEEYYFDKASALNLSNKSAEAELVYNEVEKRFGSSNQLISARQRVYQNQGSTDKAALEIEKLIAANPGDVRHYLSLSDLYDKSGNTEKALEVLLKAKSINSSNAFVHLGLADIYSKQGKDQEAISELKTAFMDPALHIDAKVGVVLSFFPKFKDVTVRTQATELAKVLTQTHPMEAKAFSVFGDVLYQDQKIQEAKTAYKKALELNPQIYQLWDQLLRIEVSSTDYHSAIVDGEEALTNFPNQAALYFYTAVAYSQTGQHEKAISYLKNASSLEVDDKAVLSQIYSSLGDSYNALKKYKESDLAYNKALELDPNNTYVMNNYAYYLSLRGENLSKAAEMSRRSNELQSENASFQDTYAWVLFRQKKFLDARIWIERAIKNNGNSGVLAEHYGDILFNLGEKELAFQQWRLAKEKGVKSEILERKINEKKFFE